jgi:hypothetical protein
MYTREEIIRLLFKNVCTEEYIMQRIIKKLLRCDEPEFINYINRNGIRIEPVIKNKYFLKIN